MSEIARQWVLELALPEDSESSPVRGLALLVLVELAHAADEQGYATAPIRWLAKRSGLGTDVVMAALSLLAQAGYVACLSAGGGRGKAALYRLPLGQAPTVVVDLRRNGDGGSKSSPKRPSPAPDELSRLDDPAPVVVSAPQLPAVPAAPQRARSGAGVGVMATLGEHGTRLEAVTALARAAWVATMPGQAGSDALMVLFQVAHEGAQPVQLQVEPLALATGLTPARVRAALVLLAERGLVAPLGGRPGESGPAGRTGR